MENTSLAFPEDLQALHNIKKG